MPERSPPVGLWPEAPPPGRDAPPARWVVYVDLDAYYVSCELRERPELAGRPVIVGPPPSEPPSRGVVLSASYEARAFGVHSAQPARIAAAACPDAVWIPPDFAKYERISRDVRALLGRHSTDVVPFSIDEAAVGVDAATPDEARAAAERIQRELRDSLGLPASLGVASTRMVAKIACDKAKPGGILIVAPREVATFVAPLPVRAIPGVGPKTEELLKGHGITLIGELATVRPSDAAHWLGSFGRELVALARGELREAPVTVTGPRSRSTDHTFGADVDDWPAVERTVRSLAADLARGLEREGLRYGSVGVAYRWSDFSRSQRLRTLSAAREGVDSLVEPALRLARELWESERAGRKRAVRTVSVRTERLTDRSQRQARLDDFPREPSPER